MVSINKLLITLVARKVLQDILPYLAQTRDKSNIFQLVNKMSEADQIFVLLYAFQPFSMGVMPEA